MSQPVRVLVIDDDPELCDLIVQFLATDGFNVHAVHEPETGIDQALEGDYSIVILDVMMPGMDGFDVLRRIRRHSALPVLMLTARGEEIDRVVGLEIGADDYLSKPFSPRELVARLRAILRRASRESTPAAPRAAFSVGALHIDPGARRVMIDDHPVTMTSTEFDLLHELAREAGRVVTRDTLSTRILQRPFYPDDRTIDVHISNIRRKLRAASSDGHDPIETLRGTGYLLTTA